MDRYASHEFDILLPKIADVRLNRNLPTLHARMRLVFIASHALPKRVAHNFDKASQDSANHSMVSLEGTHY